MSAVSNSVTPASSAALTTVRVPSRSTRIPKLLQPRPTTETSGPSFPNRRVRIASDARASGVRYRRLGSSDLAVSEISLGSWLTYGGGADRGCPAGQGALPRLQRVAARPDPGGTRPSGRGEVRLQPAAVLDPVARA